MTLGGLRFGLDFSHISGKIHPPYYSYQPEVQALPQVIVESFEAVVGLEGVTEKTLVLKPRTPRSARSSAIAGSTDSSRRGFPLVDSRSSARICPAPVRRAAEPDRHPKPAAGCIAGLRWSYRHR